MLNIYLTFAEFLIIWSGNLPDEIPWYLNRIRGGWWVICTMDFIFHWVIPFSLLLSRDLKRSKSKMIWLTCWMLFARAFDLFWLIEPNFPNAARNLHLAGNWGILAYITVPVAVLAFWAWYYLGKLMERPLINTNDPHLAEMLEPEHAH
jgi:drug/metabolite transporter (DMT)-like permease